MSTDQKRVRPIKPEDLTEAAQATVTEWKRIRIIWLEIETTRQGHGITLKVDGVDWHKLAPSWAHEILEISSCSMQRGGLKRATVGRTQ